MLFGHSWHIFDNETLQLVIVWLLDDIANKTDNNKTPDITAGTWFDYYRNLNKKTNFSGKDLIDKLEGIENEKHDSELDNKITTKEISSLKNNKASSFDSILNEMLKYSQSYILKCLHKLFNSVLTTGIFPKSWAKGII